MEPRDVIDGLFAFVGVLTPDGVLVEANRAALQAAGLRPEDVIGRPFEQTYWWSYSPEAQAQLRDAVGRAARGESCRFDALNRVAEGHFITVDYMLAPLFDEPGRVTYLIPSGVDITERVRDEERMREQGDPEVEVLEDVRHVVGRIDKTVLALLQRARPRRPQFAAASLEEAAHRAVLLARHHAARASSGEQQVSVSFEPPPEPVVLPMDAAQIEDAVLNLILNAVEAVEGRGRVVVSVRCERSREASAPAEAVIEVSDTGRGIEEENLTRVFSPFYTTTESGTGLGLPSVRRIAHAHGGRVEVSSVPGRGSTFTIHLPLPLET